VRLNVGGTFFTTSLDTLCAVPDSLLGRMFDPDSAFGNLPTDETGTVFLDRDPEVNNAASTGISPPPLRSMWRCTWK